MLNFDFLDKGLGIVSPAHFVYVFSTKISSCHILLTDQISLSGCLYFLRYWAICVLYFKINLIFLIKAFLYMTKKSRQKLKYLENKTGF